MRCTDAADSTRSPRGSLAVGGCGSDLRRRWRSTVARDDDVRSPTPTAGQPYRQPSDDARARPATPAAPSESRPRHRPSRRHRSRARSSRRAPPGRLGRAPASGSRCGPSPAAASWSRWSAARTRVRLAERLRRRRSRRAAGSGVTHAAAAEQPARLDAARPGAARAGWTPVLDRRRPLRPHARRCSRATRTMRSFAVTVGAPGSPTRRPAVRGHRHLPRRPRPGRLRLLRARAQRHPAEPAVGLARRQPDRDPRHRRRRSASRPPTAASAPPTPTSPS